MPLEITKKQHVTFTFDFASGDNPGDWINKDYNFDFKPDQMVLKEVKYYYGDDPINPKDITLIYLANLITTDTQAITAFLPDSGSEPQTTYTVLPNIDLVSTCKFAFMKFDGSFQSDLKGRCYLSFEIAQIRFSY